MNYESFVNSVARRAGLASGQADLLTRATLQTLSERLTGGQALDLAAQLPKPMQAALRPGTYPEAEAAHKFGAAEFVRRVADGTGTDEGHARNAVRAVFTTMQEAVSSGEFADVLAQLPKDFRGLTEKAAQTGGPIPRR